MADIDKKIGDEQLSEVTGGECDADKYKKDLGSVYINPATGNYVYTDKTQAVGEYTPAEWNKLKANWSYTGDPELYLKTVNNTELKGLLNKA